MYFLFMASSDSALSGSSSLLTTPITPPTPASTLCSRNVKVSAFTGMWQARHEISECEEFS
jgi:hypothetical protein